MPQITIELDDEENKYVEVFKAQEGLKNKADTIKQIIRKFFKVKK